MRIEPSCGWCECKDPADIPTTRGSMMAGGTWVHGWHVQDAVTEMDSCLCCGKPRRESENNSCGGELGV